MTCKKRVKLPWKLGVNKQLRKQGKILKKNACTNAKALLNIAYSNQIKSNLPQWVQLIEKINF